MQLAALIYTYVDGMAERRGPYRDAHLALIGGMKDAGELLIAGALGDPPSGGLLVFANEGAAQRFVAEDPYVTAGLVTDSRIEPWKVVAQRPLPE